MELTNQPLSYTKVEAAHLTGLSVRTLELLIARKSLKATRVGRRVLIPRSGLLALIERGVPVVQGRGQ